MMVMVMVMVVVPMMMPMVVMMMMMMMINDMINDILILIDVLVLQSAKVVTALRPFSTSATPPGNSCLVRDQTTKSSELILKGVRMKCLEQKK